MSEYLANAREINETAFTQAACNPQASVVVEACAGSGKTWLLVGRMVRALLAGADPSEILAITFTRRAAQEMRVRLLKDLELLAAADDATIVQFLQMRGMTQAQARAAVEPARHLYERVATARVPLTIETFHGWFWQLVAHAPLGAGVPFAPVLAESTDRLRRDAWLHFSAALLQPSHASVREAWTFLLTELGDQSARTLVAQLLDKRAEWWRFAGEHAQEATERALAPLVAALPNGVDDPASRVRDVEFIEPMQRLHDLWLSVDKPNKTLVKVIDRLRAWLAKPASHAGLDFNRACKVLLTDENTPTQLLGPEKFAKHLSDDIQRARYAELHTYLVGRLLAMRAQRCTWRALHINRAALMCGQLLIELYQKLKTQDQTLDFTDLEWHALRLLSDPDHAAYMQARLDARYRHILLDEFQDTNPLQWHIVQSWLAAYGPGADIDRPRVFVVGDPKQSIYRFRRAEPRVFEAAATLLQREHQAVHLRTNVTRRNAHRVVEALNQTMCQTNPLYQTQSTRSGAQGQFILLPLIEPLENEPLPEGTATQIRAWLTTPAIEQDNDARYREGRALAIQIMDACQRVQVEAHGQTRDARWSDVLLLVRRRTHLADYERALRDAGVPFVSDRRGGLLATLEADDLIAVLSFLSAPYDDLRLAHVLRTPLFQCADADLITLAGVPGLAWWQRLKIHVASGAESNALRRAHDALSRWLLLAGVLPVHDLLDRIYFEADVRRAYARVAPAAACAQVQANLDAFIELALSVDAGRYPSLPRFIDELSRLKNKTNDEAPDEGLTDASNAVRILTIHAAKGLEAEIVALADTHSTVQADKESTLVVWPPHADAPEHISLVTAGSDGQDEARAPWFEQENAQRAQEDWNLLYVAATRARQVLIVSGVKPKKNNPKESWYTRLQKAQALSAEPAFEQATATVEPTRWLRDFLPVPQPTGTRLAPDKGTDAQRLGQAWHALLEHGEHSPQVASQRLTRAFALSSEQVQQAQRAAQKVRSLYPHYFGAHARAEVELIDTQGQRLRIDRLVETDQVLEIIDFKWSLPQAARTDYEAQLRCYGAALRALRPDKPIRLVLVSAQGEHIVVPQSAFFELSTQGVSDTDNIDPGGPPRMEVP